MAQKMEQEKQKEVEEIRPAEENQAIDPDREHQRQEADEELRRGKKRQKKSMQEEESNQEEEEDSRAQHKLDIRV